MAIFPGGVTRALAERDSWRRAEVPSATRSVPTSQTWQQLEASFSQAGLYSGLLSTHQAYRDSTWLQPSIHLFGSAVASRPFKMWREVGDDKEQLTKHWLLDLLERPNPHAKLSAYALKYRTACLFDLDGEVFWHLGSSGEGPRGPSTPPEFLTIFRKHEAFPIPYGGVGEFIGWEFQINGVRHFADRDDVVHFSNFDPLSRAADFNPFTMQALQPNRGRSPIESKRLAVSTDLAMARHNRAWFERSIASEWIFNIDDELTTEQQDDYRAKLSARVAGKNGEVILTSKGVTATHVDGASQRDAQFSEGRTRAKEEQLAGLAPPVAMGETGATYTNTGQQMQMFYEVIVDPALNHMASTIDVNLLEDEPDVWTEFATDDVDALQAAKRERLKAASDLHGEGIPWDVAFRITGVDAEQFLGSDIAFGNYTDIPMSDIISGASKAEIATALPTGTPKPSDETNAPPSSETPVAEAPRFIRVIDASQTVRVIESRMAGPFEYQSTQINLEGLTAAAVLGMAAQIPDDALAEKGRETDAHVTVKFGLDPGVTVQQLTEALANSDSVIEMAARGGGVMTFGDTDSFPAEVTGKDYDIVHVVIDSPDLVILNDVIRNSGLKVKDTQSKYVPHATLAYVQPGLGATYTGNSALAGVTFKFDTIKFSDIDGDLTPISLSVAVASRARVARRAAYMKRDAASDETLSAILRIVRDDDAELQKIARRFHVVALNEGAKQIGDLLKLDTLIGIDNPHVKAFLDTRANLITSVNQTTGDQILEAVKSGIEAGDTPETIAKGIKTVFNTRKDVDADFIARQEVGSALNGGRFLQTKEEGADGYEWLSSRDDHVRETHAPGTGVDGEVVVLGDQFSNGCRYPQDPEGERSEVLGCRCIGMPTNLSGERMLCTEEQRAAHWRSNREVATKQMEKQFASALGRLFNDQRGRVLAEVAKKLAA